MFFLIDYDRPSGRIMALEAFEDWQRDRAQAERLEVELRNNRAGLVREVVILEASSEAALRRTHRRYFEDLSSMVHEASPADP